MKNTPIERKLIDRTIEGIQYNRLFKSHYLRSKSHCRQCRSRLGRTRLPKATYL